MNSGRPCREVFDVKAMVERFDNLVGVLPHPRYKAEARMEISNIVHGGVRYIVTAWTAALLLGGYVLTGYSLDSQVENNGIGRWPENSSLPVYESDSHIVLFVHPKCVCSRSTLAELNRILGRTAKAPRISCVFFCPADQPATWAHGELWELTGRMQNSSNIVDFDGVEARRFGVQVSGHVMLFNRASELEFDGGITSSRGHEGDNLGARMVTDSLNGKKPTGYQPPPFGCKLFRGSTRLGGGE